MNYLAHAYFSFGHPGILMGNLLSDFVKGRRQYDFTTDVQQGIRLHRAIDQFTDKHEAVSAAKTFFRPAYRLYAGAFTDVVFDHFLANDTQYFADANNLMDFAKWVYQVLSENKYLIPDECRVYFDRMAAQNWLYNYRFKWGIEKSFGGIVYRSKYLHDPQPAVRIFEANYDGLQSCYANFIPALYAWVLEKKPSTE